MCYRTLIQRLEDFFCFDKYFYICVSELRFMKLAKFFESSAENGKFKNGKICDT